MQMKTQLSNERISPGLALKKRQKVIREWPIYRSGSPLLESPSIVTKAFDHLLMSRQTAAIDVHIQKPRRCNHCRRKRRHNLKFMMRFFLKSKMRTLFRKQGKTKVDTIYGKTFQYPRGVVHHPKHAHNQ